jgi:hypothetical protein
MQTFEYKSAGGDTIKGWKNRVGTVIQNQRTGEITVVWNDSDSMCGATSIEAALEMIRE